MAAAGGFQRQRAGSVSDGMNPPLTFRGVPSSAQSLSLTLRDPDAPGGNFIHWIVNGIPPKTAALAEGARPLGVQEANGFGKPAYGGPCPPRGQTHRYVFTLVARRGQEIVAEATLTGRFGLVCAELLPPVIFAPRPERSTPSPRSRAT